MIATAAPNLPCLSLLSPVCVKSWLCMRMFLSVLRLAARDAAMSIATETPTEGKCSARPHQRPGSVASLQTFIYVLFPPEMIFSLPLFLFFCLYSVLYKSTVCFFSVVFSCFFFVLFLMCWTNYSKYYVLPKIISGGT